jgi:hypothetical protein
MFLLPIVQRLFSLRASFTIVGIYSRDWIHWGVSFILYIYICWFFDSNTRQALTLPTSPKAHLRPLGLGTLIALLMFEAYNTLTVQFVIPPPGDNNSKMIMVKSFKTSSKVVSPNTRNFFSCTTPLYKRDTSFFYFYL